MKLFLVTASALERNDLPIDISLARIPPYIFIRSRKYFLRVWTDRDVARVWRDRTSRIAIALRAQSIAFTTAVAPRISNRSFTVAFNGRRDAISTSF